VENSTSLARNDKQATADLLVFVEKFFFSHKSLAKTPFFVVGESYGGRFATELGVALTEKINAGSLDINFKGKSISGFVNDMLHVYTRLEILILRILLKFLQWCCKGLTACSSRNHCF